MFLVVSFNIHFFFFKQKTAYEMRISDWSSDVCSSDLAKVTNYGNNIRALESVYVRAMALADGLIFAHNPAEYAEDNKRFDAVTGPPVLADAKDWLTRGAHKLTVLPYTRSEEHTSELQSLMRISYADFCLKKKT